MSAMANTTPLVTTVTKPATNPRDADTAPGLDFREGPRERTREDSQHLSARARTTKPERLRVQDRLRYGDRHVLDRLGHRRQSAFDRLSETYSLSTTKCKPRGTDFRDHPRGRSRPHKLDTSNDCPKDMERFCSVGESYDDSFSHSYRDGNHFLHMKRRRDNESPLSSVSKSDSSDGRYRKSRSKRHKSTDEDDLTRPWMYEEEDPFTPRIRNFESSRRTRMPNNVKTYDGTGDPDDHVKKFQATAQVERWPMPTWCHVFNSTLIGAARVSFDELPPESINSYKDLKAAFLAYFMQQKKYVKVPVEIHNIKQKDGETIEDFMERHGMLKFPVEGGIVTIRSTILIHAEYTSVITSSAVSKEEMTRPDNFKVALHPDFPDQEVAIGGTLSDKGRTELCSVLKKNLDVFAWQPSDMTGVPRSVAEHRLNIREGYSPVRQKNRGQAPKRAKAIQAEVQKLVEAGITREVYYYDWLSNPVMRDIEETFRTLRKINMKLNLKKCAFGLAEGVFLGYVVTLDGIKPCLDKTAAELQLPSPRTIKEVQSLNGKLATKRLRPYFQARPIAFITDQPIKQIISRPDVAGRLQKWSIMLGEHNITYRPRTSIKRQILADFLIEMPDENPQAAPVAETQQVPLTLYTDGSSSSNNEAEYEALIDGLRIAARMRVKNVHVLVEVLKDKSIKEKEVTIIVEKDEPTWMTPIVEYLKEGTLPNNRKDARKLRIKARQYELMEGILYRRSFLTPWLRCVGP
nr:reverse transcriptase domain-containing protein [Tanacetum cinerariifolium]